MRAEEGHCCPQSLRPCLSLHNPTSRSLRNHQQPESDRASSKAWFFLAFLRPTSFARREHFAFLKGKDSAANRGQLAASSSEKWTRRRARAPSSEARRKVGYTRRMEEASRDGLGLRAWQWPIYPQGHRSGVNRALHIATVPLFLLGTVAVLAAPFIAWQLAAAGLGGMLVALVAQGRGHKSEVSPPRPFRGPFDVLARFFVEQWVTFPRYVLSGRFAEAWRAR